MKLLILTAFFAISALVSVAQESNSPSWERSDGNAVRNSLEVQEPSKEPLKLFIPNAFTPNEDGINDVYTISSSFFKSIDFSVYDRWGNEVFVSKSLEIRWDGKVKSSKIPAGVYVYVFDGLTKDDTEIRRSGTISVIY